MSLQNLDASGIARLKISLNDIKPIIWRVVEVPLAASLKTLHEIIQAVMLFENYHLFRFDVGSRGHETHYGIPDPQEDFIDIIDARTATLGTLANSGIAKFIYTYDFGDDWRHTILIEEIVQADPAKTYPRLIRGANRAPPEDVGGFPGFAAFLDAMVDANHPEHASMRQWYGGHFDPKDISEIKIKARLAKLAKQPVTKQAMPKSNPRIN
jgi:hypothetical protein